MSTSRTYHHGRLRDALLDAARTLLVERGVEGLSLREVSRRAVVSHTAAYNHFRDKGALVGALVDAAFVALARELRAARDAASEPREALREIGVAYVRFAYRHPSEFKIMFRPELLGARGDDPARGANPADAYSILTEAVARCQALSSLPGGDPAPLVLAAWSSVHGLASLIVDGPNANLAPDLASAERLARGVASVVEAGLRADAAPGAR